MCGLTGFFSPAKLTADAAEVARHMSEAIIHRGPDDAGVWVDAVAGIALAHRRLSILDLSPAGHQPMASNGGRYVIVFNGEIYNHLELREALSGMAWRGHSDTETLLAHPAFRGEIDRDVLALYLRHNYVPAPYSIYRGIAKLPPGSWLTLPADAPVAASPSTTARRAFIARPPCSASTAKRAGFFLPLLAVQLVHQLLHQRRPKTDSRVFTGARVRARVATHFEIGRVVQQYENFYEALLAHARQR